MKKSFLTLPALLAITANMFAQTDGNYQATAPAAAGNYYYNSGNEKAAANYLYNQNNQTQDRNAATRGVEYNDEISIGVNGLINVVADNYVAVFNIIQVGPTARSADSLMGNRINQFKIGLKTIGVDTSDVRLDMISFVPRYEYKRDNAIFSKKYLEVPIGFELQKNVYVHFKHSKNLDAILSTAAQAEIYDLVKVDYFIPSTQRALDSLRLRCMEELKMKIKSYQMAGFRLDTLKKTMADDFKTIYPETKYLSYKALSHPSIGAIKKRADDQPFTVQADVPYSKFYSQVNYDNYDMVINPVITEPVVQLSYSINVKYFLKEEEKSKSQYYIITTNGELKQLNVK